jgi:MarR family 2-MHQ and catechol resistance regulon transcriptional repressor
MTEINDFGVAIKRDNYCEIVAYGIAHLYHLMEKEVADYLRGYDLTPAKFNTLLIIKHVGSKQGISQIEIGKRLIVTASNMTRLIDNLIKEGYVIRSRHKTDRRINLIKITQKGKHTLENVWPGYLECIKKMANKIDKKKQKIIANIFLEWGKKF